ncbi:MAG TPA: LPS export ABC transporter periplasmic protein LptC [Chitinophagaceae bacterium]|nr:LPS export ABC transporter periplasmic protein LptC [Chitinophagaceae bacterium]
MNNTILTGCNKIIAAAYIISCCFVSGCENDERRIHELTDNKILKEEAKEIESLLSQDGKMKAKLIAPLMIRVNADTTYFEFPHSLHVDFYDDSAMVETKLDCKYGKYFENLNKVFLRDSVIVVTAKGDTLKSPDLWWDQNTKLFYTANYVEYRTKTDIYYGRKGLRATQDLTSVIFNDGGGTVQISENGFRHQ